MTKRFQFLLLNSDDGQFYFVLRSGNNKVLMTSETYKIKRNAQKSIKAIQDNFFFYEICDVIDGTI